MNNRISDEELVGLGLIKSERIYVSADLLKGMATELLQLREEKRKAEEARVKSWGRIPKWVRWKATDRDGTAFLYEIKPIPCNGEWMPPAGDRRILKFVGPVLDWKDTLEERP